MDKNKSNVPKIRFPGFTDPWEQRKFEDFTKLSQGLQIAISKRYTENIGGSKYFYITNEFLNPKSNKKYYIKNPPKNVLATKDDILMTRTGNTGKIVTNVSGAYHNNFFKIDFNHSKYDKMFLYYLLNTVCIQKEILSRAGTSTIPDLNHSEFYTIKVVLPSYEEQKKIGTFFIDLDDLITLHQRKLNHLQDKKKGLLQKMFPKNGENFPELRFPGFTDPWEQRKLGEISDKVTEKNTENFYNETFTNSAEFGIVTQRYFFDKDISNTKNLNGYYVVQNDDFVYNPRISNFAPVGPIKRNKLARTGVMSPLYYVFRTHDIDKTYLEHYFDATCWHRFMKINGDSGARADRFAIKDSVFKEMPIPFPNLEEQKKIGYFFEQFDTLITIHQRKLNHLQEQKKALLQQMFI